MFDAPHTRPKRHMTVKTTARGKTTNAIAEKKATLHDYSIVEVAHILARRRLPPGTSLAIIAPNEAVKPTLRRFFGKYLLGRVIVESKKAADVQEAPVEGVKTSRAPVVGKQAFEASARAKALLRGVEIAEEDLRASGGAYSLQDVRRLLRGVSRQGIAKQVQEGSLLAVPGPSNRRCYPTVQFQGDGTVVKGLKEVRKALPTQNPWAVLNFLVSAG